jgi:probable HAF family extracellular repeat protein
MFRSRFFVPRHATREPAVRWPMALLATVLMTGAVGCSDNGSLVNDLDSNSTTGGEGAYSAILLATPGATASHGRALNDADVATGQGWFDLDGSRTMRWSEGVASELLGAVSGTIAMNNHGAVVGWVRHEDGVQRGFLYADGIRTDLESLSPGISRAGDINDAGTIVGLGRTEDGPRALVWRRTPQGTYGTPLALEFGSPNQHPRINSRGDIVFSAAVWGGHKPAIWPAVADGSLGDPIWLGRPTDASYFAMDINDQGVVVGYRQYRFGDTPPTAVVWLPGDYDAPVDLGVGEAWAINEKNQIVGFTGGQFRGNPPGEGRPALWIVQADGSITGPHDLSTPEGYESGGATDINEAGVIIGTSWGPGELAATLWMPGAGGG